MRAVTKLIVLLLALIAGPALAQQRTMSPFIAPLGYCQLATVTTATQTSTCAGGIPARTQWAMICIDTAAVRWRDDGVTPTIAVGMPIAAGGCINYSGTFATLQFIAQTGSPVVNISFYSGAPRV